MKHILRPQKNTENKGFTIIETLVAITILMVAITGPLTISQRGLTNAVFARDQLVATYLAQDALEFVHYARDWNVANSFAYNNDLITTSAANGSESCAMVGSFNQTTMPSGGCIITTTGLAGAGDLDTNVKGLTTNNDNICQATSTIAAGGIYDHGVNGDGNCSIAGGAHIPTQFHRRIFLKPLYNNPDAGTHESLVQVIVTWSNGTLANSVMLSDSILNQ